MKLAIFGAGMIVHDFMTFVHEIPEIELTAILGTELDAASMETLQAAHEIKKIYTDLTECLADEEVDTVYVALPNHLHYTFAKAALLQGKHVICEKPFTLKKSELLELAAIAKEKQLILIEAITNQYLANYHAIQEQLTSLGELKLIECNYSQYSSRYDLFKEGTILPAFNPKMGGGALMDINIYNIHFVIGLLGAPKEVRYFANIEQGIDTSGVLLLDYEQTKVICIGAKDSTATIRSTIQGTKGSIIVNGPTNVLDSYDYEALKTPAVRLDHKVNQHRMFEEFKQFQQVIADNDQAFAADRMAHSQRVMDVVEAALADAKITLG
ncbi:Gfo/Idh/MocA family oxidoreductase [Enterococcus sp.]|uniref:Gfo/Idh/MocA family protein n=1 Tax=Enterococcus sp. TaxID=35783 RepID=UPI0028A15C8D|nr:Gfo/Idh/MocA family oxidoreductase [Enterococcus sp.]